MDRETTVEYILASPECRDAIARGARGVVIRLVRDGLGLRQEDLGRAIGYSQATISRLEKGAGRINDVSVLSLIAQELRIPRAALGLASEPPARASGPPAAPSRAARVFALPPHRSDHATALQAFREADKLSGGGHLYGSVLKYLHTELGPRLFGGPTDDDGQALFTSAAGFAEMVGWMSHDGGHHDQAMSHFRRSLDLVRVGGDRQLAAHIYASMSHISHHERRPEQAIRLARQGRKALASGPANPELSARLFAMEAKAFAALGQPGECGTLLAQAETSLASQHDEPPSTWVSPFDEASFAAEAARCMRHLGSVQSTAAHASRVLNLRPVRGSRSRAFGQLNLTRVLIAQRKPDEACALAQEVLDATVSLGSHLVAEELVDLRQRLEPYRGDAAVREFLGCLEESLRTRLWLSDWMHSDDTAKEQQ